MKKQPTPTERYEANIEQENYFYEIAKMAQLKKVADDLRTLLEMAPELMVEDVLPMIVNLATENIKK